MRPFWFLSLLALAHNSFALQAPDNVRCYERFYEDQAAEAVAYCQRAADSGHAKSTYLLGVMYFEGKGVRRDERKGLALLDLAANMGDSDAQKDFGTLFQQGVGVTKNMVIACDWWEKSAGQNNYLAQTYLAGCYLAGEGRPQDAARGYAYLLLAARLGHKRASQGLEMLKPNLSEQEVKDGEALAATLEKGMRKK